MKVYTKNEYSQLKSIILGRPEGANWPTGDIFFDRLRGAVPRLTARHIQFRAHPYQRSGPRHLGGARTHAGEYQQFVWAWS